jgi:hypothetical protein
MKTPLGRRLVEVYYELAPSLAKRLENKPETAAAVRGATLPIVNAIRSFPRGE